jgi:hypothetical protein
MFSAVFYSERANRKGFSSTHFHLSALQYVLNMDVVFKCKDRNGVWQSLFSSNAITRVPVTYHIGLNNPKNFPAISKVLWARINCVPF